MMTQDMDARRDEVIDRLSESGFTPQVADGILRMVDAMMTGRAPLANVLVAATEVCKVCDLSETHGHVADAVACLAGEVLVCHDPYWDHPSDATGSQRIGIA